MCGPLAVPIALAAGSMLLKGTEIAQTNQYAGKVASNAVDAARNQYDALSLKQSQINSKSALEKFERERQALREQSKLLVASGEAGILGGVSPARAIVVSQEQAGFDEGILEANRANAIQQTVIEGNSIYTATQGRLNQARSMAVNPFMAALQIGTAGAKGWVAGSYLGGMFGAGGGTGALTDAEWANANSFGGASESHGFGGSWYGR